MSVYIYNLTSLTGSKRNANRTVLIKGFEVGRRNLIVFTISALIALMPTLFLSLIIGTLAWLIVPPIVIISAFILVEGRTRSGLNVRVYQSIIDRRRAKLDELYICFRPVDDEIGEATIVASSIPATTAQDRADHDQAVLTSSDRGRRGARRQSTAASALLEDVLA